MRLSKQIIPAIALALSLALGPALESSAQACQHGTPTINATVPPQGAADVPTDARLGVWWNNFDTAPVFDAVSIDSEPILGTAETLQHNDSAGATTGFTLWTPDEPLPPGARVKASVTTANHATTLTTFSFVVGDSPTQESIAAPSLLDLTVHELTGNANSPCSEARRVFNGDVSAAADPTDMSWLLLYRTTPDGTLGDWLTVLGTAADTPQSFTVTSLDLDLDLDAECFTLVQMDPAGGRVSSAEARCATLTTLHPPLDENSTRGCTTAPPAPPACLLLLPAIAIRRRKGAR